MSELKIWKLYIVIINYIENQYFFLLICYIFKHFKLKFYDETMKLNSEVLKYLNYLSSNPN